jgi:hypothetical protein
MKNTSLKCKLKDLVHDLEQLGVEKIKLCSAGVGIAVVQDLRYKGIHVEEYYK